MKDIVKAVQSVFKPSVSHFLHIRNIFLIPNTEAGQQIGNVAEFLFRCLCKSGAHPSNRNALSVIVGGFNVSLSYKI